MATRLKKPVVRHVEVSLRAAGFRDGLVCRVTDEGVYVKPPRGRWSNAMLATWASILTSGAYRKAEQAKRDRAERRRLKKAGA